MLRNQLKDILKDSSIYGISKVLGQMVSFFLIPLYTSYLTPEDYGILSMVGLASASLGLLMTFGLDSATYRYVGLSKDESDQRSYVGNAQFLTILSISFFTLLHWIFMPQINALVLTSDSPFIFLWLGIGNGVFSSITSIPRAYLRINRKVKVIAISSLINVFCSIGFTLFFVVYLKKGVSGALLGNMMGTLLSSIYILFYVPRFSFRSFNKKQANDLLVYCLPTLPTQLFAFAIPLYSQWSVKNVLSLNELGLYAVGLKFTLPLTLALTMFQQAYAPYKFQIIKTDPNPKATFSKIMNLFVIGFGVAVLVVTMFGGEVLKFMTALQYHSAAPYVYYIALIPFAQGLYFMFTAGLEFTKSPIYRPIISGAGLITVLLFNHTLIQHFGVPGAAISIVISWLVMALGNIIYAQQLYKIHYNWILIVGVISLIAIVGYFINEYWASQLLFKILLSFVLLVIGLFVMNSKFNLKKILRLKK